jgi:small-conductance mechanosensitive channel
MSESNKAPSIAAIEQTIKRLRNVLSVRVAGNGQGAVDEIHVLVDNKRSPKQVGRDIESALMSELGVRVDHRKISIAQVRENEARASEPRLQLSNISMTVDRRTVQARVTLGHGEDSFAGLASAPSYEYEQLRLVAEATLHAVSEYLHTAVEDDEGRPALVVQRVEVGNLGEADKLVTVSVRLVHERGDETLVGSAFARQDLWKAAACATLDAVNRRLPWFVE